MKRCVELMYHHDGARVAACVMLDIDEGDAISVYVDDVLFRRVAQPEIDREIAESNKRLRNAHLLGMSPDACR